MLIRTALELGLISSLTVLALFLSYSMLNICDLSTDGVFTIGACVGAVVALSGHPFLSIFAALAAGILAGLITALLQTRMGVDSLLSGIIVNTASFSINIAIMGKSSLLNMNKITTIFTMLKDLLQNTFLENYHILLISLLFVIAVCLLLNLFLKTRLGLAIRATGNNPVMVESSSIDPSFTTIIGLMISSGITALSGCLLAQAQKSVNIDIGSGILTICLASLLIGRILSRNSSVVADTILAVLGAIIFRTIYTAALRLNMPAYMLKLISAVIVLITISLPYMKERYLLSKRKRSQHA
ncbi:MAG: ABC transporter permease [Erysipelotrichaceae bacterium]|nr:ABC transporter permease [Erysipelotrichaceae bacterium]